MDVGDRLRGSGYRMTPQRRQVWEVLRKAEGHLSAEQIHELVNADTGDLNVASVYRTLTLLDELGLTTQVNLGDGRGHWELAHPDDEFHLACRVCGEVTHHPGDLVAQVRDHLAGHGFSTEAVDLVVHGVCDACGERAAPPE